MIPVLDILKEKQFFLLKKSDIYDCKITQDKTLLDILYQVNVPWITAFKSYISQLCAQKPYWDEEIRTDMTADYQYAWKCEEPNALTEAVERGIPLLSFEHPHYNTGFLECIKNNELIVIDNIQNIKDFLSKCIEYQTLSIDYIIENYPYAMPVAMARLNDKCYAKEALEGCDLTIADLNHIVEDIAQMIEGLKTGTKNRFWDSIDEGLFEFRANVSDGRIFRMFFVPKQGIQFLNGFIKKTEQTPLYEIKKAKQIKRDLNL